MALELKALPAKEAVEYFRAKGYAISFDWRDVYGKEHAAAWTVAKAMRVDILQDIREAVDKAIARGISYQEFRKNLEPILRSKGWWGRQLVTDPKTGETRLAQLGSGRRLGIIFDTNMRTAQAAGRWERAKRLARDVQERSGETVYLRYVTVLDSRTRAEHRAWHEIVLPIDHPFWDTHYPPNGWGCRCTVQILRRRDLDRLGYQVSDEPEIRTRTWRNKRTNEDHQIPEGIDPGFEHNVGQAAMRPYIDPAKYTIPALGHEAARLATRTPAFRQFLTGQVPGNRPVGHIDQDLAGAIGANVRRVDLSQETMVKQLREHPELTAEEYELLPEMFARGRVVKDGDRSLVFFWRGDQLYAAVVKATETGRAAFLTSFRRAHGQDDIDRIARRGDLLRDFQEE